MVAPSEPWQSQWIRLPRQPAIGIRVCAKQTLANGHFNERERFLGLSRFGLSNFGAKLYGVNLSELRYRTGLVPALGIASCSLRFGGDDEFPLCPLGGLRSHFAPFQQHAPQPSWNGRQTLPLVREDFSTAPPPEKRNTAAERHILVLGNAMADWLVYGLDSLTWA